MSSFTVVLYFYDYVVSLDTGELWQLDSCNSSLAQLEIKLELFDKQGKDLKFVQLTTEHKVFKSSNRSNGIKQTSTPPHPFNFGEIYFRQFEFVKLKSICIVILTRMGIQI